MDSNDYTGDHSDQRIKYPMFKLNKEHINSRMSVNVNERKFEDLPGKLRHTVRPLNASVDTIPTKKQEDLKVSHEQHAESKKNTSSVHKSK